MGLLSYIGGPLKELWGSVKRGLGFRADPYKNYMAVRELNLNYHNMDILNHVVSGLW